MSRNRRWEVMGISFSVVPPLPGPASWYQPGCQTPSRHWGNRKVRDCLWSCRKGICRVSLKKYWNSKYGVSGGELNQSGVTKAQVNICKTGHLKKSASALHTEVQKQEGGLTLLKKSNFPWVHVLSPGWSHLFWGVCRLTASECVYTGACVCCSLTQNHTVI